MLNLNSASLTKTVIHFLPKNEGINEPEYSSELFNDSETIEKSIFELIDSNFKTPVYFSFDYHNNDFILNPLYNYVSNTFDNDEDFLESSIKACKLLFDKSKNTFIESGYFFYGLVKDVLAEDQMTDMVVIIKFEEKTSIFDFVKSPKKFGVDEKTGYSIKKPHKICLVLDIDRENGYKILQIDPQNKIEANYWMKDFLHVKAFEDQHFFTSEYIRLTLNFAKRNENSSQISSLEKADLKNKTKNYFSNNETFLEDDFLENVFDNETTKSDFLEYKEDYQHEKQKNIPSQFQISEPIVHKNAKYLRSIIKLDKNFHIYVHGSREKIEKIEESDGTKYYKLYFDHES